MLISSYSRFESEGGLKKYKYPTNATIVKNMVIFIFICPINFLYSQACLSNPFTSEWPLVFSICLIFEYGQRIIAATYLITGSLNLNLVKK